jgi:ribosomal protein L22
VALVVEEDEAADPVQVGGFGARGVMAEAKGRADMVEQSGWHVGVPLRE